MKFCYKINDVCTCYPEKQNIAGSQVCFTQLGGGGTGQEFGGQVTNDAMNFIESNGLLAAISISFAVNIILRKKQ